MHINRHKLTRRIVVSASLSMLTALPPAENVRHDIKQTIF